jgi:hypothetical protein
VTLTVVLCLAAGLASAQFQRGFGSTRMAPKEMPDRDFAVCRIMSDVGTMGLSDVEAERLRTTH